MVHPWHDIDSKAPDDTVRVVVEIAKGSRVKYELDKESGLLRVDRILYSSVVYPANYGFLPRTLGEDDDPLDALLLCTEALVPLAIARGRPIGVLLMVDEGRSDDKIVTVHADDPAYADVAELTDLPRHVMREVRRFFEDYKALEGRTVRVDGPFGDAAAARDAITAARERYQRDRD